MSLTLLALDEGRYERSGKGERPHKSRSLRRKETDAEADDKDQGRKGRPGEHRPVLTRRHGAQPKASIKRRDQQQMPAIENRDVGRIEVGAVEPRRCREKNDQEQKDEVENHHRPAGVRRVSQPALVTEPEYPCDNKTEKQGYELRRVGVPNLDPIWRRRAHLSFRKVISKQRHRDAENRVAQRLQAPHLEQVVFSRHFAPPPG